jgi:hypothetical protein
MASKLNVDVRVGPAGIIEDAREANAIIWASAPASVVVFGALTEYSCCLAVSGEMRLSK